MTGCLSIRVPITLTEERKTLSGEIINPGREMRTLGRRLRRLRWSISACLPGLIWGLGVLSLAPAQAAAQISPAAQTSLAYITNHGSATVSVIDTANNNIIATVPVAPNPYGVAINPAGTRVYVTHNTGGVNAGVSVIDTTNNYSVTTVTTGANGRGVAVNPAGTRVYVANYNNLSVSVIDTTTTPNTVTKVQTGQFQPYGVAVNHNGTRVYVANFGSQSVSVIDTTTTPNTFVTVPLGIPAGQIIAGLAINPAGTRVYVANSDGNRVFVLDTSNNQVIDTVMTTGSGPYGVAVNSDGTRVYVSNTTSDDVSVIDTTTTPNTVFATVPVGDGPLGVDVNSTGTRVYVANSGSGNVSVIDTGNNTVVNVPVGAIPTALGKFLGANPPPTCHFTLTQSTYGPGSTIQIHPSSGMHVTNPGPQRYIEYKTWIDLPGGGTYSWADGGGNVNAPGFHGGVAGVLLSTNLNTNVFLGDVVAAVTSSPVFPPPGAYSINCRLMDSVTGQQLALDKTPFAVVP